MNAELLYLGISVIVTILVTTIVSILSTRSIIRETTKETQKILDRIAHAIHDIAHLTEKVASHSEVEFEFQGIKIAENIETKEEAEKLGEVVKYNSKLKVCYYKPKKSVVN